MARLRRLIRRVHAFLRPARAEAELAREIDAHLALLEDEHRRRGSTPDEARTAARVALGGIDRTKERHRDARSFPWLEDLRRDVPYAVRSMVRTPGFTAAAILSLALGIGANTAIFTVVHSVLVKRLTYSPHADRLVRLRALVAGEPSSAAGSRSQLVSLSGSELNELLSGTRVLSHAGTFGSDIMGLSGHEDGARLPAARVSASTFEMLGIRPVIGRTIEASDEAPAADLVALLGYSAWQRYFAGDPAIAGRTVMLDSVLGPRTRRPYTIVGVMPASFAFPGPLTQLWMPRSAPAGGPVPTSRGALLGRLADGVSLGAALAELDPLVRRIRQHGPEVRYELLREQDEVVAPVRPALLVLSAAAGFVLLLACVNVANLLLARSTARGREMAVRGALGASRGRLFRQSLTEGGVLAMAGGAAGLVVAAAGVQLLHLLIEREVRIELPGTAAFPRFHEIEVDATTWLFALASAIAAGLVAGVTPALRTLRSSRTIGVETARSAPRSRTRDVLIALEVALATLLLVASGLVINSFVRLMRVDPGYDAAGVLTFQVSLPADTYPDSRLLAFAEGLVERLRRHPGVEAAAYANQLPMVALRDTAGGLSRARDAGRSPAPEGVDARYVSRDYLDVMDISVVAGRGLEERDDGGQPRVVLVNRALAERQFPGENPVGQIVYVGRDPGPWTIVGVVENVRQFGLHQPPQPQFFADLRQWSGGMPLFPIGAYYAVRARGDAESLVSHVRGVVRELDGGAALFNVAPMERLVSQTVAVPRLYAVLLGIFAGIGLALALVGIYGVLAYSVLQRTREIGIRMALGARPREVVRFVLRHGVALTALGLAVGLAAAAGLGRYLESLLFGVTPLDPMTYAIVIVLLTGAAMLASCVPARRAARVDPAITLRCE